MGKLIVSREKAMFMGRDDAVIFIDDKPVCNIKNGETATIPCGNTRIIKFHYKGGGIKSTPVTLNMGKLPTVEISFRLAFGKEVYEIKTPEAIVTDKKLAAFLRDEVVFDISKAVGNYFAISESEQKWSPGNGSKSPFVNMIPYRFDDIIDFEVLENNTSVIQGGVGRAIAGGILFGGAGALLGGITGKRKTKERCNSLVVKIAINDIDTPAIYIPLLENVDLPKNSPLYTKSAETADEISSLLNVICNKNRAETQKATQSSAADEIRKFKALLDEGIITEEEFATKKKELLGI